MHNVKRPIFLKFALFTLSLLITVVSVIAFTNSNYFTQSSIEKEEISNLDFSYSKSKEVENYLLGQIEKIKFYSLFMMQSEHSEKWANIFHKNFNEDNDLVSIAIKRKDNGDTTTVKVLKNYKSLKMYGDSNQYLNNYERINKVNYDNNFEGNISISNISYKGQLPLIHIVIPLLKNKSNGYIFVISAIIKVENLYKIFSNINKGNAYLINERSELISSKDPEAILEKRIEKNKDIIEKFNEPLFISGQLKRDKKIVSLSKNKFNLLTIIEQDKDVISMPAKFTTKRTLYFGAIVLSISTFFVFLLSNNFTSPIEKIVSFTQEISKGNFNVEIEKKIQTKDELQHLANALDKMTNGLKEREKIKGMFKKFHGNTIAEDILKNPINRRGTKKEAVVYFSDIRGFTSFSESKDPEEVVEMLNEYFEVMVNIINKHGGVVDKFIGDAIMAIWGIPTPTDDYKASALNAALEMRIALVEFNRLRLEKGKEEISIGAGLHFGELISGTIGSEERMEYTAIGDAVNTAARIEASTKSFGTDLLISEELRKEVDDKFIIEKAGVVEAKGKSNGIPLFKVNGFIDSNGNKKIVETKYSNYKSEKDPKINIA